METGNEILVHISGPATKKDDERFRAMAQAYAAFETARRISVSAERDSALIAEPTVVHPLSARGSAPAASSTESEVSSNSRKKRPSESSVSALPEYIDDTQLARAAISSQLWTDSLEEDVADDSTSLPSPLAQRDAKRARHVLPAVDLDDASALETSSPAVEPTRRSSHALSTSVHEVQRTIASGLHVLQIPFASIGLASSEQAVLNESGPESRPAFNPHEENFEAEVIMVGTRQLPIDDPENIVSADVFQEQSQARSADVMFGSQSQSAEDFATAQDVPSSTTKDLQQPQCRMHKSSPHALQSRLRTSQDDSSQDTDANSILPPAQPVSLLPTPTPESTAVISQALAKLNSSDILSSVYNPAHQVRELRPFERGHWRIGMDVWDADVRAETWRFLSKFIADGRGGTGLWCTQSTDELVGEASAGEPRQPAQVGSQQLRVYTWGCTVAHIYRLLYVASKSKIKKCTQVDWVDAEGKVVIRAARQR